MPDDQMRVADEDELVDESKALMKEPIVGVDKVVFDSASEAAAISQRDDYETAGDP